jgi:DNA topoisomerase 2-associated protein PAT1
LLSNDPGKINHEMERREAEVWGLAAAMAVNAPEEEQTNLVGALRDTVSCMRRIDVRRELIG